MDDAHYPFEFLYDGNCRICQFDVAWLRRGDTGGRLVFIDVTSPSFDPAQYGRKIEELLARIHGRRADGVVVEGPEVFRLALSACGWGRAVAVTRWPLAAWITERAYRWFARNRITLSRRHGGVFARMTPACDANRCRAYRD